MFSLRRIVCHICRGVVLVVDVVVVLEVTVVEAVAVIVAVKLAVVAGANLDVCADVWVLVLVLVLFVCFTAESVKFWCFLLLFRFSPVPKSLLSPYLCVTVAILMNI